MNPRHAGVRRLSLLAATMLAGCAVAPQLAPALAPAPAAPAAAEPAAAPVAGSVPPGMQYLYGSGEAAAISVQAWRALVDFVAAQRRVRPAKGVVLAPGATLDAPRFVPCGTKPLAAVFDVDETVLLNLGFEGDESLHPGRAYDQARWSDWERTGSADVVPTPGAREAMAALRAMGVTVVFNTNRSAANAAQTEAAINGAALGPAKHGNTLFLQGDDATGGHKDARRAGIAARFCVVAMGGDQLGDFSDLFNDGTRPMQRRAQALSPSIVRLWGAGWFVLPNPVYGTALKGGMDEIFPRDKRWSEGAP